MILKKIKLENIRSYEHAEIDFKEGSTILAGDIGSGKTTILLALEFALFGLQPGQKGTALLKNGKDEGNVLVEIDVNGKKVIIERGLKRGKSVNQSYAIIEQNGEREELSITELKNKVLHLLDYPKEFAKKTNLLYRFTVYTPQEEMKQIILEPAETRLDTLRHIFGIDKYKRIKENTELFTAKLRESIRSYEGQIKDFEEIKKKLEERKASILSLNISLERLKDEVQEKKNIKIKAEESIKEVEEKIKEKEKFEKEVEKTNIMILGKKDMLDKIDRDKKFLEKQTEELSKISFSIDSLLKVEEEIRNKDKEHEEKNRQYFDIQSRISSLELKAKESEKSKSSIKSLQNCPTCFQPVPEDYKNNVTRKFEEDITLNKKEIDKLKIEKDFLSKEVASIKIIQAQLKKQLDDMNFSRIRLDSLKEKKSSLLELEKNKIQAEKDILFLEEQSSNLKEQASILRRYDLAYESRKKELEEARKKEKEKEIEFASTQKEKEFTLKLIDEINNDIEKKESIKKKLLKTGELEDWLSSSFLEMISFTEKNIMLKLREEFSKLFDEWFNILVPENFFIRLDEEFTPIIEQQGYQLDYAFLSGGERTAVALAYRLALNQVINSLMSRIKTKDLVVLDEPTDGFSEQQLDKMRDVLSQLKVKQLIIVSHESKIESFVENIIKFRKEAGLTKVG